jgi:hypothetical protein
MRHRLAAVVALSTVFAAPSFAQALSGPYTVGPGGSYATLAAAISALTTNGVAGPTSFTVLANDAGPISIGPIPGQGAASPVTINGGGFSLTAPGFQFLAFNGCSYVTVADLVFSLGLTAPTALETVSFSAATTNCVVKSCTFLAATTTSGSYSAVRFTGGADNRVEDCDFGGGWEAFNVSTTSNGTILQRNRIRGGGWWIGRIGGPNSIFRNNFVYGSSNYGVSCGLSGSALLATNLKIVNNSFYIVHPQDGSQYCALRWYADAAATTECRNNAVHEVFFATTNGFLMWCSGALRPTVSDNNVFFRVNGLADFYASTNQTLAGWQGLGFDASSVLADPLYLNVGASPPDLHLISGSPCVGLGATLASVTDDIDGSPRSTPYDAGAHEFSSFNLLTFTTSGGGTGDLYIALDLPAAAATEGFLLVSANAAQPLGTGPVLGLWPDAMTWDLLVNPSPLLPGNPLHFAMGSPGFFPTVPFIVSPGILSFLAGQTWDAVVLTLGPGYVYTGASNVQRAAF